MLNSDWLIYLLFLTPLIALALMVVMVVVIALNWRLLSDALGFGLAFRRKQQKKGKKRTPIIVWVTAWLVAIALLEQKCQGRGILCSTTETGGLSAPIQKVVAGNGPGPVLPSIELVNKLGLYVQTSWFTLAFVGLAIVCSMIVIRGVKVSLDESKRVVSLIPTLEVEGKSAVEEAIRIMESSETLDPRNRIIRCYQRMVEAAQRLGAPVTSVQTARELETAIRRMLLLTGPAIEDLTMLFEEARYSLHMITDKEAEEAHRCLLDIAEEMKLPVSA